MNARFNEEQVRIRLVSRELEIAQQIQRSLLPKSIPRLPGMELAGAIGITPVMQSVGSLLLS